MKPSLRALPGLMLGLGLLLPVAPAAEPVPPAVPVLRIDAGRVIASVSPRHAGLMTEEINHSYDGGFYGELISNRSFREEIPVGYTLPPHWTLVRSGGSDGRLALDDTDPVSAALPTSLRIVALTASAENRVGVANDGFWGMPVKPATVYRVSFHARVEGEMPLPVTVAIEGEGGAPAAQADVMLSVGGWHRYEATLTTAPDVAPTTRARFTITTARAGAFTLSLVSLFPPTWHDRPNGNRIDLMQRLADLQPAFLRLPGGNYLEGNTIPERFDWRKTLGDLTERPGHMCPWGYRSSDGLGLLEFMHWCEDLNVEPVLGVYAGLSLQGIWVKPGADLQPYVQEALDEIEYLTGDTSTAWGARRARDGHPEPFKLTYVEIGNEDWPEKSNYDGRFTQFYDAIKARYPELQLIATAAVKSRKPDVLDDHYYRKSEEFFQDVHHYDHTDRTGPKIFVGEWATMEGTPTPNMHAALGDAAWMTGMERNSDLIIMQAYAPLLANVNPRASQWPTNLIGYDALTSYGSPSYYAQVMFNAHRGDVVLDSTPDVAPECFHSVTRDIKTGAIYIKVVNARAESRAVRIEVAGVKAIGSRARAVVLAASRPEDTNTLAEPDRIRPVESAIEGAGRSFDHTFPAYSITVLVLQSQ